MTKPLHILLVEDDPGEVILFREAMNACGAELTVDAAANGRQAMEWLSQRSEEGRLPQLVVLDLNMPGGDGLTLLREMKADSRLLRLPVVVLTTSDTERDVNQAYELGASSYIQKPINMDDFVDVADLFQRYWSCLVTLPS